MEEKYKNAVIRVMGEKGSLWQDHDDCLMMISPNNPMVFFTITYTSHGYYLKALDGNELKVGMLFKGLEIQMLPVVMGFLIGLLPMKKVAEQIKDVTELKHGQSLLGGGSIIVPNYDNDKKPDYWETTKEIY